ncbi:MAG: acetyltransferase [Dethiobacteria bacterium]|jgi:sugar O-acyltransferase (sialic acid O-acetyltransferase NeuD family)
MKDIVILGAGGFAREASLLVEELIGSKRRSVKSWNLLGYIDEDEAKWGLTLRGYPVLGGWEALDKLPGSVSLICVLGDPVAKKKLVENATARGREFVTLVHPEVSFSSDVRLGKGVLINKGCIFTTNITIGNHVSINPGCGIGHDAVIEDYTTLMWHVNISGAVEVGKGCLLGTKATVLQGKKIGNWATVGAGAVVTEDLPPNCTAVGVPAQIIKQHQ